MKKLSKANAVSVTILAVAFMLCGQVLYAAQHAAQPTKEVTLEGEVLDMYCFMKHPETGQGPEHAKCAKTCMEKGLPIGYLTKDGTVYLLIGKDHESAAKMVADYAGKASILTGTVVEHHGVKAIEIASIKPAK